MRSPARSVAWLLPFLLTGCFHLPFHKKHPVKTDALAPSIRPPQSLEVADIPLPPADAIISGYPIYNMRVTAEPVHAHARYKGQPNSEDATSLPEQGASANAEVSAIGQLSSGDTANYLQQTENSVADIERRLNSIDRAMSDSELKTADHIREFLKQARAALASGDVEGARTLSGKAQVLLAELTK